jgi:hypothetical protein
MVSPIVGRRRIPIEDIPTNRTAIYVALYGLALAGIVLFGYGLFKWVDSLAVSSYAQTTGQILSTGNWSTSAGNTGIWSRSGKKSESDYFVRVVYAFNVGGVEYKGTRINTGLDYLHPDLELPYHYVGRERSNQQELLSRYRADRYVEVYYDPADPSQSVLSRGLMFWDDIALWTGLPLAFLGIVLLFWMRRTDPEALEDDEASRPGGRGSISAD